jgi:hypothetical protein
MIVRGTVLDVAALDRCDVVPPAPNGASEMRFLGGEDGRRRMAASNR